MSSYCIIASVKVHKLKILHFCYSGKIQPGVIRQLSAEYSAADKNEWEIAFFTHSLCDLPFVYSTEIAQEQCGLIRRLFNYFYLRWFAFRWLYSRKNNYDLVVIRWVVGDVFTFFVSIFLEKYLTLHHTKEFEEAMLFGPVTSRLSRFIELVFGNFTLKRATGIAAVTDEILEYEFSRIYRGLEGKRLPGFVLFNGINLADIPSSADRRGGPIKLLFLAAEFQPWHGLDLLLKEVSRSSLLFELHLVGKIGTKYIDDDRIIIHGSLDPLQIEELSADMDMGIGSLAMYRNGLKEGVTLKVREYLARGIPVYATHKDSAFNEKFPYFIFSEAISLSNIISMAAKMRLVDRKSIREAARPFIDKDVLFQEFKSKISRLVN